MQHHLTHHVHIFTQLGGSRQAAPLANNGMPSDNSLTQQRILCGA
jgi:hypothetical protein